MCEPAQLSVTLVTYLWLYVPYSSQSPHMVKILLFVNEKELKETVADLMNFSKVVYITVVLRERHVLCCVALKAPEILREIWKFRVTSAHIVFMLITGH